MPSFPSPTPRARATAAAVAASLAARVPHQAWAIAILAAFAIVGAAFIDDYGITNDEPFQRSTALANLRYIMGDADALPSDHNRYYGVAFDMPLLLAERALGLTDGGVYPLRRAATHLFFLCGAFACYALAYRMFGSVPLALLAMLLFILHPRLYAHSIFNSKDSPFLAMFMIALYLAHRAFGKNSVWAFALLGVCVGLAANIRIMGAILVPAVLGLRMLDLLCADGWRGPSGRGRVLATSAAFAAAAGVVFYISLPYLWNNPLAIIDALNALSDHPYVVVEPFQGDYIRADALPWRYIPVWIWITTPPLTLLFAAAGSAAAVGNAVANPSAALRNGDVRFALLLVALFALPIIAMAAIGAHMNNGWRQVHFLYAPMCIIAVLGLRQALRLSEAGLARAVSGAVPRRALARFAPLARVNPALCARAAIYGAAGVGLASTAIAMIQLHPYEHIYFNFFVDRETPERLRTRYTMDYYHTAHIDGWRRLIELHPSGPIFVNRTVSRNRLLLPEAHRSRIIEDDDREDANNYHVATSLDIGNPRYSELPEIYAVKIYNSTILAVYGSNGEAAEEDIARFMEDYAALTAAEPDARAYYDIYVNHAENAVVFAKSPCSTDDLAPRFFLHIVPADPDHLPVARKRHGFINADFWHQRKREAAQTGTCLNIAALPNIPISRITAGQFHERSGVKVWTAAIDLAVSE